jgi:hypothetical protein
VPARRNDLFEMFPDLPWLARPSRQTRQQVNAGVDRWRARAIRNILRQRAAAEAVKNRIGRARRER